jgi:hypothetical protein
MKNRSFETKKARQDGAKCEQKFIPYRGASCLLPLALVGFLIKIHSIDSIHSFNSLSGGHQIFNLVLTKGFK